ncbi:hypothetical protein T261_5478 [Streptomyces lydicus]|nr:hypothetical protein T261_5478 [Streptomyces lydicus]
MYRSPRNTALRAQSTVGPATGAPGYRLADAPADTGVRRGDVRARFPGRTGPV